MRFCRARSSVWSTTTQGEEQGRTSPLFIPSVHEVAFDRSHGHTIKQIGEETEEADCMQAQATEV